MFRIAQASALDAEGIAAVAAAVHLGAADTAAGRSAGFLVNVQPAAEYARRIEASGLCPVALDDSGRVIGFLIAMSGTVLAAMEGTIGGEDAVVRALLSWGPPGDFLFVDQLAVAPGWRGRGVARALYRTAAAQTPALTHGCCILLEPIRNEASIAFFESEDFRMREPVQEGSYLWGLFRRDLTSS